MRAAAIASSGWMPTVTLVILGPRTLVTICMKTTLGMSHGLNIQLLDLFTPHQSAEWLPALQDLPAPIARPQPKRREDVWLIQPRARAAVEEILNADEYPPPSAAEVARRVGLKHRYLGYLYPEAAREISRRFLEWRGQEHAKTKEKHRNEVRRIVEQIVAEGDTRITRDKVKARMQKPSYMRHKHVRDAYRQAKTNCLKQAAGRDNASP